MEFESPEKAMETLKASNLIEIEGQKVKLVRQAPDFGKHLFLCWLLNKYSVFFFLHKNSWKSSETVMTFCLNIDLDMMLNNVDLILTLLLTLFSQKRRKARHNPTNLHNRIANDQTLVVAVVETVVEVVDLSLCCPWVQVVEEGMVEVREKYYQKNKF